VREKRGDECTRVRVLSAFIRETLRRSENCELSRLAARRQLQAREPTCVRFVRRLTPVDTRPTYVAALLAGGRGSGVKSPRAFFSSRFAAGVPLYADVIHLVRTPKRVILFIRSVLKSPGFRSVPLFRIGGEHVAAALSRLLREWRFVDQGDARREKSRSRAANSPGALTTDRANFL